MIKNTGAKKISRRKAYRAEYKGLVVLKERRNNLRSGEIEPLRIYFLVGI